MRILVLIGVACLALTGVAGCGSNADEEGSNAAREAREARVVAGEEEAELRAERRSEARALRRAARRQARRVAARERREAARRAAEERAREEQRQVESEAPPEAPKCHSSYEGACLDPSASDYDCEGGSGDGPLYTGTVTVVGPDEYGLDSNGDGVGCEP
jgi:membrane protein involved in colicin uptake